MRVDDDHRLGSATRKYSSQRSSERLRTGAAGSTYAVHLPFLNVEFVDAHTDGWNLHRTWEFHQRARRF